jgi:hypothetical protein
MPRIDQINRQTDTLLLVCSCASTIRGTARLQQLLFLLNHETRYAERYDESVLFTFEAATMGPFSGAIYDEVALLRDLDAIEMTPHTARNDADRSRVSRAFSLTATGETIVAPFRNKLADEVATDLAQFVQRYARMDLDQLLQYVASHYPDMIAPAERRDSLSARGPA